MPDVVLLTVEDGTGRMLNFDGKFYALSAIAVQMVHEALKHGAQAAASKIETSYQTSSAIVRQDIEKLLSELQHQRLIRRRKLQDAMPAKGQTPPAARLIRTGLSLVHKIATTPKKRAYHLLTLARLSFVALGWTQTVATWLHYHERHFKKACSADARTAATAIGQVVRRAAAEHLLGMGCKERALSCWTMLRAEAVPAVLTVGVNLFPLASHSWCEFDALILDDHQDRCERFFPVIRYP